MNDAARTFEALEVAMAMAPGVYARNRMFSFFERHDGKRARARALVLRGIVRHLARADVVTLELAGGEGATAADSRFILRYTLPSMHLSRAAELSRVELAVVRVLAGRAGTTCLAPEPDDHRCIDEALGHLLAVGDDARLPDAAKDLVAGVAPGALRP